MTMTKISDALDRTKPNLEWARDEFLNLVADATRWEEEWDVDGAQVFAQFRHECLENLLEALGIPKCRDETCQDALNRAIEGSMAQSKTD